jgi:hypothetical protein
VIFPSARDDLLRAARASNKATVPRKAHLNIPKALVERSIQGLGVFAAFATSPRPPPAGHVVHPLKRGRDA